MGSNSKACRTTPVGLEAVDCPLWVFCSDGTQYRHPDAHAIARILNYGVHPDPTLAFNVPSRYSRWWDNDEWRNLFEYQVRYGTVDDGLTVRFEPNTSTATFI